MILHPIIDLLKRIVVDLPEGSNEQDENEEETDPQDQDENEET